jgi:hypothetical protein
MTFVANVVRVLIASPGDTAGARDLIEGTCHTWNSDRAAAAQVVLLPRRWETDAVPLLGMDGQTVINAQLVDDADIVFGVFYSRVGRATPRGASGTVEELERSLDARKPVHVYFSDQDLPADVDLDQVAALRALKERLQKEGLYGTFTSQDDLKTKVRSAIEHDLSKLALAAPTLAPVVPAARPRVVGEMTSDREFTGTSKQGKAQYRTRTRFTLKNIGSAPARNVRITRDSEDGPFILELDREVPHLQPGVPVIYGAGHYGGSARSVNLHYKYEDDAGHVYEDDQTIS